MLTWNVCCSLVSLPLMASISALCKHCEALVWQQEVSALQCLRTDRCMPGQAGLLESFFLFRAAHQGRTSWGQLLSRLAC